MSVLDQAENIGGIVSAARQRERWQQQMAKTSNEEKREQLREAIGTLEFRFPELEDVPPGGAEAFARERGHGKNSRSPSHEGRRRPSAAKRAQSAPSTPASSKKTSSTKKAGGGNPKPASSGRDQLRRGASRAGGRARSAAGTAGFPTGTQAWQLTGIPGGVFSGTSLALSALGGLVGLSLIYLVLNSSERGGAAGSALPQLLGSVTRFLQRFVSTQDFFGPATALAASPNQLPTAAERADALETARDLNLPQLLPELQPLPRRRGVTRRYPEIIKALPDPAVQPRRQRRR